LLVIRCRDPHEIGNHGERNRRGVIGDPVDLANLERMVEELGCSLFEAGAIALRGATGKGPLDQSS
jgi:hypothetical protein